MILIEDRCMIITVDEGNGDEMSIAITGDGNVNFEIHDPWAGSTETGFGAIRRYHHEFR